MGPATSRPLSEHAENGGLGPASAGLFFFRHSKADDKEIPYGRKLLVSSREVRSHAIAAENFYALVLISMRSHSGAPQVIVKPIKIAELQLRHSSAPDNRNLQRPPFDFGAPDHFGL